MVHCVSRAKGVNSRQFRGKALLKAFWRKTFGKLTFEFISL